MDKERLYLLRHTHEGVEARKLISPAVLASNVGYVVLARGRPLDARERCQLRTRLRLWAMDFIRQRDVALPWSERRRGHQGLRALGPAERRGRRPGATAAEIRADAARICRRLERVRKWLSAGASLRKRERLTACKGIIAVARILEPGRGRGETILAGIGWPDGEPSAGRTTQLEALRGRYGECSDALLESQRPGVWCRELHRFVGLVSSGADPSELRRVDRSLARVQEAAHAVACIPVKARPHPRDLHRRAIGELGCIWHHATGVRPTREDDREGKRVGPCRSFVSTSMSAVWPNLPSVDGLVDEMFPRLRTVLG
jgi:hypothetical protein